MPEPVLPDSIALYCVVSGDDPIGPDPDAPTLLDVVMDPHPSPADCAISRLAARQFWRAVREILTPREWEAVSLVYLHEFRWVDAAARMGVTKQRIQQLLALARGKLYRALTDERKRRTHDRLLWD